MADHDASVTTTDTDLLTISDHRSKDIRVTGGERLRFAKQVLLVLGGGSALVFTAYALFPDNQALASIFELVKIGLLPLVTLVVSFYFPKMDR